MRTLGLLCLTLLGLAARADELEPEAGAEARVLSCGYSSKVQLSSFRWEVADGTVRLVHRTGTLDTGARVPKVRGKPPPGCPFGLPGAAADWQLTEVTRWTRTDAGWVDAKGTPVTVRCSQKRLKPVTGATALVINPRGEGCAGENQLMLKGGPRVEKKVVRCQVLQPEHTTLSLSFGVELVMTDNDCGGGSDYRVP